MVTDTEIDSTFDLAEAASRADGLQPRADVRHHLIHDYFQQYHGYYQQYIENSLAMMSTALLPTEASAQWVALSGSLVALGKGLQTGTEPTEPLAMDEAQHRADFLARIDALLSEMSGQPEPVADSATSSFVRRMSDLIGPTQDEFLDDSWEPVSVLRTRASRAVSASVRPARPLPFEAGES